MEEDSTSTDNTSVYKARTQGNKLLSFRSRRGAIDAVIKAGNTQGHSLESVQSQQSIVTARVLKE